MTTTNPTEKYPDGCTIKENAGAGHTFMPGCEKYNPDPNAGFGASPTEKGCCPKCGRTSDVVDMAACPFCYPTKESGESNIIERLMDEWLTQSRTLSHNTQEQWLRTAFSLVAAHTEKQAREEGARKYEGGELVLWTGKHCYIRQNEATRCTQEAYQRGADEMVERCVEEAKRIADLYRKAQYGLDDEILKHILTSLRSLQKEKP